MVLKCEGERLGGVFGQSQFRGLVPDISLKHLRPTIFGDPDVRVEADDFESDDIVEDGERDTVGPAIPTVRGFDPFACAVLAAPSPDQDVGVIGSDIPIVGANGLYRAILWTVEGEVRNFAFGWKFRSDVFGLLKDAAFRQRQAYSSCKDVFP